MSKKLRGLLYRHFRQPHVVKRDLSDAEIEELGAQEAERKEFCPNCEAETPCTHEAELFVCDICGEDFAKYIVSRNCNVSDVSMTQGVLTDVKTPLSIEMQQAEAKIDRLKLVTDKFYLLLVDNPDTKLLADAILCEVYGIETLEEK